jgi:hypothetical protein
MRFSRRPAVNVLKVGVGVALRGIRRELQAALNLAQRGQYPKASRVKMAMALEKLDEATTIIATCDVDRHRESDKAIERDGKRQERAAARTIEADVRAWAIQDYEKTAGQAGIQGDALATVQPSNAAGLESSASGAIMAALEEATEGAKDTGEEGPLNDV